MKLRLTLAATSAVLALSSVAAAQQPWLTDNRYGEGIGIRTGNFELHPSIAAEFGYDTNYFQRAGEEPNPPNEVPSETPVEDAFRLRVTPSLTLSTLRATVHEHLASYKVPRAILFVPKVLRAPSGKTDYRWASAEAAKRSQPPS